MLASISQTISSEGSDILNCQLRTEHDDTGFAEMTILGGVHDRASCFFERLQSSNLGCQKERRGAAN